MPLQVASSVAGGLLAGRIFTEIWQRISPSDQEPPDPKDLNRSGREAITAAALQGLVFGLVRALVDRAGAHGYRAVTHESPEQRHGIMAQVRSWLTRNVRVLSAVSFLQDAASELLYPLLPIYLTSVLGAPAAVVGAVEGAAEGAASLTKLAAGPLGDRFARRPLIATGYGMAALGKVMVAAASAWPGVLAGRVVDRLGKGIRGAPRDALLVVDIDDAARGRVFGFHRAMDTLGAVVGPLIGLAGYELLDHQIAPLLWVAVVPAVLSVALVFLVRETRRVLPRAERRAVFARVGDLPRRYWRVTTTLVLFGLVNFPDALLLLRLNEIGFSVVEVILAYVTYNAVYAVASYPAGMLADRIPRPAVFGVGLVFFAIGYTGLGLTTDTATAWVLIGVYGLFTGCTDGVGKAWISTLVGSDLQASAQGVFQGASGFAVLAAGLWAGFLWGADGHLPLLISGVVGGVFAVGLLVIGLRGYRTGTATSTVSSANGGAPTPTTE